MRIWKYNTTTVTHSFLVLKQKNIDQSLGKPDRLFWLGNSVENLKLFPNEIGKKNCENKQRVPKVFRWMDNFFIL